MKNINQKIKMSFVVVFVVFIASALVVFASVTPNSIFNEIKHPDEIQKLEDEKNEIEETIAATKAEYEEQVKLYSIQEQELASLQAQIMDQIAQIEQTELDIENKTQEVEDKKLEVKKARIDVEDHIAALRKRLRAMYKFGKTGYLQIILRSENLVNALTRLDRIRFLADYDKSMLEDLQLLQEILEIKQAELEDEKQALEDLKEQQIEQKEALEISYEQELAKKQQIFENMEALERQKQQLEAESQRITQTLMQMKIKRDFVGGEMIWPLDYNFNTITSFFGPRIEPIPGSGANHGAIDIAAPTGNHIYAALGGEILASEFMWGYGNCVMIDHGGGIVTLYAHASQRLVSKGDYVNRGDVIALVGSTGFSTGPHLHFEVRVNGTRVDPLNYVVRP